MKATHWIIAAAALTFVQPTLASAGVNDPEVIIYRFPGVRDDTTLANIATVFHCTNFSGVTENIRFVARSSDAVLLSNKVIAIPHLAPRTAGTHDVLAYGIHVFMNTGSVAQGTIAIAATSINIICTAETIDASNTLPVGVARRGIRFSPVPGSQE